MSDWRVGSHYGIQTPEEDTYCAYCLSCCEGIARHTVISAASGDGTAHICCDHFTLIFGPKSCNGEHASELQDAARVTQTWADLKSGSTISGPIVGTPMFAGQPMVRVR